MSTKQSKDPKRTFVPPSDRPEVKAALDPSPGDWGVRPIPVILGQQLARTHGSDQNSDLMQKCCEKRRPDLYDLMGSRPPGVPGLESLIEVEAGLTEQMNERSQKATAIVSHYWSAGG